MYKWNFQRRELELEVETGQLVAKGLGWTSLVRTYLYHVD